MLIKNKLGRLQKLSGALSRLRSPPMPRSDTWSQKSGARDRLLDEDFLELDKLLDQLDMRDRTLAATRCEEAITPSTPLADPLPLSREWRNEVGSKSDDVAQRYFNSPEILDYVNHNFKKETIMSKEFPSQARAVPRDQLNGWLTDSDGTQKHYKNGLLHRDGNHPAEIRPNGTSLYYKNGNLHRDGNLPAMIGVRGTAKFSIDGKYHRLGGLPAVTWSKGPFRHEWWVNGEIQRALKKDGTQEWYADGSDDRDLAVLHRVDGPAVIHPNGREEFHLNGQQFGSREQWLGALDRLNDITEEALDRELIDEDPVDLVDYEEDLTVESQTTKAPKSKKVKTMTKPSFTETLKTNAVSAGYRVAGTQLTTVVRNAILAVMRKNGADGGAIQAFSTFLDTEYGTAMISFAIGSGLPYVPHFGDDPRVARLATELQVGGMATVGNAIMGEAMQHVLPAISQILQSLPAADGETSNVRVIESKSESKLAETLMEEEEDAETTAEPEMKTMKA